MRKPKLMTAAQLSERIHREADPTRRGSTKKALRIQSLMRQEKKTVDWIFEQLERSSQRLALQQIAADSWVMLCRERDIKTRVYQLYAPWESDYSGRPVRPRTQHDVLTISVNDDEFQTLMIALERAMFNRGPGQDHDVLMGSREKFSVLFNRLADLPGRPTVNLDRSWPGEPKLL